MEEEEVGEGLLEQTVNVAVTGSGSQMDFYYPGICLRHRPENWDI